MQLSLLFFVMILFQSVSFSKDLEEKNRDAAQVFGGDASMRFFDFVTGGIDPKVAECMVEFDCSEEEARKYLAAQIQQQLAEPGYGEYD